MAIFLRVNWTRMGFRSTQTLQQVISVWTVYFEQAFHLTVFILITFCFTCLTIIANLLRVCLKLFPFIYACIIIYRHPLLPESLFSLSRDKDIEKQACVLAILWLQYHSNSLYRLFISDWIRPSKNCFSLSFCFSIHMYIYMVMYIIIYMYIMYIIIYMYMYIIIYTYM